MLADAKKYGARIALYGRKINNSEHQLAFITFLRLIADDEISPEEAVRAYHGVLQEFNINPYRSLEDDMQLTNPAVSYAAGSGQVPVSRTVVKPTSSQSADKKIDFKSMTPQEKIEYQRNKWNRILGS
jgi:hypothetical protein